MGHCQAHRALNQLVPQSVSIGIHHGDIRAQFRDLQFAVMQFFYQVRGCLIDLLPVLAFEPPDPLSHASLTHLG